jgi:putative endopeptidase
MVRRIFATAGLILVIFAAAAAALAGRPGAAADAPSYWGFDTANLDKTCKPCDDFYRYAMGGWIQANPIPPEYSTWGSFTVLLDKNQQNLRQILDAAVAANAPAGSN